MKVLHAALAALALLFVTGCPQTKPAAPPPLPPVINSFSADKTTVSAGQAVKLTFTTTDAKEVSLIDQSGAEIPVTGTVAAGEATVMPTSTSFYVLRATGDGGKDSAFVQVAVNEALKQVFLIAVPTEITSGESVELVWSALGGKNITVKDSSGTTVSSAESGTQSVTPERTTTWTLRADGPTGMLSATARVSVKPAIKQFVATPPAARQGQKIKLEWKTAGADGVVLKESHFGELVNTATDVDTGSYEFTVPFSFSAADAGSADAGSPDLVPDNLPLRFTLTATASSPMQSAVAILDSVVRDGPMINSFDAPVAVTENQPFSIAWNVSGFRAELLLDGAPVYSTLPPAPATSSLKLPGFTADTQVTLVAYDYLGLQVSETKLVKVVKAPKVVTFTLDATVPSAGAAASAAWTTTNASLVVVRLKNGPAVFTTNAAAAVASGTGTVNPARDTVFVLEAYNEAGDRDTAEKLVVVTNPATASATPSPTSPNTLVQLAWDISSLSPTDVIGIPSETVQASSASTSFVDLENLPTANKLYFADRADGTSSFTAPQGFKFPFIISSIGTFTAGVNGFLALAPTAAALPTNVDLKATTGLPPVPLLAPFWDNLDLGASGDVYWALDGNTFPRKLIVQWNKVHVGGDPSSNLTFQVQLFETGEFRYVYKTLQDANSLAQGQSATVGVFAAANIFSGQYSFNTGQLAEGAELAWFTQGAVTGMVPITVGTQSVTPGFFYRTAGGGYVYVSIPVRVFGPGSVIVNEAMPQPNPAAALGQYVELFNPQTVDLDISGLQLVGTVTTTPGYILPANTMLPAKGYLVLGQSADMAQNGEAGVTIAYATDLAFGGASDGVRLVIPGTSPFEISKLTWVTSNVAEAVQNDAAIGTLTCVRTQKFGTLMSTGTPGKINESCFDYQVEQIPVAFEDVSSGAPLFSTSSWDDNVAALTLPMPFKYFGAAKTSLTVSSNGWLAFKALTGAVNTNRITVSSSSEPVGAIAPLWDDIAYNATIGASSSNAYQARIGTHQVIQWSHVSTYAAPRLDDLNFEVKLFDTGVIEFHYGEMTGVAKSSGGAILSDGSSATVWIENVGGTAALPIGLNAGVIQPRTAYRFTPKP